MCLKIDNLPVFIPVKKTSIRCPGKNQVLLPHTLTYLQKEGFKNIWVISDSDELLSLGEQYKVNTFKECLNVAQDELQSCWNLLKNKGYKHFVLCPVTHPFRSKGLIEKMVKSLNKRFDQVDFLTTCNLYQDRSQFIVNEVEDQLFCFKNTYSNRKGMLTVRNIMVDGALYLIKKSYLRDVIKSSDTNKAFWAGRFSCVRNYAPFLDIDTMDDLDNFKNFYD